MSQQLTISSIVSVIAMAALCIAALGGALVPAGEFERFAALQAELLPGLPI